MKQWNIFYWAESDQEWIWLKRREGKTALEAFQNAYGISLIHASTSNRYKLEQVVDPPSYFIYQPPSKGEWLQKTTEAF